MKKLMIAAIALVGFSAVSFPQPVQAVKKKESPKMQVVKKPALTVVTTTPVTKTLPVVTKPVVSTPAVTETAVTAPVVTRSNTSGPLKPDGTPDMRNKSNQGNATGPLKKDGKPDKRFKANKN
jgi:hypothetical protein